MIHRTTRAALGIGSAALVLAGFAAASSASTTARASTHQTSFYMIRSAGAAAAHCIPHARAFVTITNHGATETMTVTARGLPRSTDFDLFVIQVPSAPFGVSWYQGDLETNSSGVGRRSYVGRFSVETFAVAPGVAPAPRPHGGLDGSQNPAFKPIHTFHVGLWFNSPKDAAKAGCPNAVTPFNGEHNAGVQALSTRQFALNSGPLRRIKP